MNLVSIPSAKRPSQLTERWPTPDIPSWNSHFDYTWPIIGKPKLGKLEFRMLVGHEVSFQKTLPCLVAVLFKLIGGSSASGPYERRSAYLVVGWS